MATYLFRPRRPIVLVNQWGVGRINGANGTVINATQAIVPALDANRTIFNLKTASGRYGAYGKTFRLVFDSVGVSGDYQVRGQLSNTTLGTGAITAGQSHDIVFTCSADDIRWEFRSGETLGVTAGTLDNAQLFDITQYSKLFALGATGQAQRGTVMADRIS